MKRGGFRSDFEYEFHKANPTLKYEPFSFEYEVRTTRKYTPDFVDRSGKVWYELKGYFRQSSEAKKYLYIRDCLPEGVELVFVFMDPKTPMPGAKKRKKCGTKFTVSEWAEKNGFRWTTLKKLERK